MNKTKQKMYLELGLTLVQALDMTIDLCIKGILTEQEAEIAAARLHDFTLHDIGERFHITSARVSQIEQRILRKIDSYDKRLQWVD